MRRLREGEASCDRAGEWWMEGGGCRAGELRMSTSTDSSSDAGWECYLQLGGTVATSS